MSVVQYNHTMKRLSSYLRRACFLLSLPVAASSIYVYVMNNAGTTVDVIDAATNKIVQSIDNIDVPESARFSPDGSRVYIGSLGEDALYVVDRKSGKKIKKIPMSGHVNDLQVTMDGKRVLVCTRQKPGRLDIIDTASLKLVKSIEFKDPLHDIELTKDGKYAVVGSPEGELESYVDLRTDQIVGETHFDQGAMTFAIECNPDGSGRRIYQQLKKTNGFAVVDFATRKEISRVIFPVMPNEFKPGTHTPRFRRCPSCAPAHGMAVSPDGKTLWANSHNANSVFVYSLPDVKLIGHVTFPETNLPGHAPIPALPEWITFTPDGKKVYVTLSSMRQVMAIDAATLKEIARIPVGEIPKRDSAVEVP